MCEQVVWRVCDIIAGSTEAHSHTGNVWFCLYRQNVTQEMHLTVSVYMCHQSPGGILSRWVMKYVSTPRPYEFTHAHIQRGRHTGGAEAVINAFLDAFRTPVQRILTLCSFHILSICPVLHHKSKTFTFIGYSACISKTSSCLVWGPSAVFLWLSSILGTSGENIENTKLHSWITHWEAFVEHSSSMCRRRTAALQIRSEIYCCAVHM